MSTVFNHTAPAFAPFAPMPNRAPGAGAQFGGSLKRAGLGAWRGAQVAIRFVLDGELHGALEVVALVTVIASTAVFTLAAFGVPVGLD